ncbi:MULTISPECIES: hypothetical protein [unclassified Streptomyces]|uniref:hypothetical protein n=1 Tax=unclassified Streptomyces TaxID=2593676 RepID=UPI0033D021A2
MENPDPSFRRRLLIESLTVLAADAPAQVAWLSRHGVLPDDIALDFDHAQRMAHNLMTEGQLAPTALADLKEIDTVLSAMSAGHDTGRWTTKALSTDPGWNLARRLARQILVKELGTWSQPLPEITVIR